MVGTTAYLDPGLTKPALWIYPGPTLEDLDVACNTVVPPGAVATIDTLAEWAASRSGVDAAPPTATTIGGRPARMLDVPAKVGWTDPCPAVGYIPLVAVGQGDLGIGGHERSRLIFVDLGGAATALVALDAPDGSDFDGFVAQAMPIVGTFAFSDRPTDRRRSSGVRGRCRWPGR